MEWFADSIQILVDPLGSLDALAATNLTTEVRNLQEFVGPFNPSLTLITACTGFAGQGRPQREHCPRKKGHCSTLAISK
jgi:hypothetical protein